MRLVSVFKIFLCVVVLLLSGCGASRSVMLQTKGVAEIIIYSVDDDKERNAPFLSMNGKRLPRLPSGHYLKYEVDPGNYEVVINKAVFDVMMHELGRVRLFVQVGGSYYVRFAPNQADVPIVGKDGRYFVQVEPEFGRGEVRWMDKAE